MSAYCARADIESVFGATNVGKWADIDDDADDEKITARIAWAISSASNEIDDRLRNGPYVVPFGGPPQTIKEMAASLAGVKLYESRGVQDFDSETGRPYHRLEWHRTEVKSVIQEILSGQRKLDAATQTDRVDTPQVVK